jgi:putative spermidine/putrescine transport system permease protein
VKGANPNGRLFALSLPITILLGIFFFAPILMVLSLAFTPYDQATLIGKGVTLENFARFLTDPNHLWTYVRTIGISAATTILCIILGFPIAWHLHRLKSGQARLWFTLAVLLPLMVSLVVASFAWALLLGNNGVLNSALIKLGIIHSPIQMMNTITGVIIVNVFSHISYAILPIFAALENVDSNLARAARIHGAIDSQILGRVILPLSLPGIVAGSVIVFSLSMAAFVIPFLIGGGRVNVVPLQVYQYTVQFFNWPGAATLSIILLTLTLGATWVLTTLAQRAMPWERGR